MKKFVFALLMMGSVHAVPAFATTWGDFAFNAQGDVIKWTIGNNASAAYFYDAIQGRSVYGAVTSLSEIGKFITVDVGYAGDQGDSSQVILGGKIKIDKLISETFPGTTGFLKSFVWESAQTSFNLLNVGAYTGFDAVNRNASAGIYSGLEFRWK